MPTAEIITIGTEILLGEIVDTNTRYLSRNLREQGISHRQSKIASRAPISSSLPVGLDRQLTIQLVKLWL
jgi:nicotinamide-nucleotide amidase